MDDLEKDLENIEGIGMDRDFEDMEMDVQPTPKTKKKSKPKMNELDWKIFDLLSAGYNVNQIASMLAIHSQYVKQMIDEKL